MNVIGWIILGLIAGFVASKVVNQRGSGVLMNVAIGIIGALLGSLIFDEVGLSGFEGLSLWSFFVAVSGAMILLIFVNLFRRPR